MTVFEPSADEVSNPSARYDALRPDLERLKEEVLHCLNESDRLNRLKIHSISGRVKTRDSFLEKIARKAYELPFSQTDDLVGVRIVCLFNADLSEIAKAIGEEFLVVDFEDKVANSAIESFGYRSHHFVCRLKDDFHGRRYERIKGQRFEVQCRTILMDAWASVSHHLSYKGDSSIPDEIKKDFYALSGLLYVADRQFQGLLEESQKSRVAAESLVRESADSELDKVKINLSTVLALLGESFPGRKPGRPNDVSEFIEELTKAGITSLSELRHLIAENTQDALVAETEVYIVPDGRWSQIGIARKAVSLGHEQYRDLREKRERRVTG